MQGPIRFVSCTVTKILDLVAEKKMSVDAAIELIDVMRANGFTDKHDKFFDAVKQLVYKVSSYEESTDV
jgi:hypothetical protein